MTTEVAKRNDPALAQAEAALVSGDLAKLSAEERLSFYHRVCESLSLNPFTQPFEYIVLNGKLKLYARKDCTDQLRRLHRVSVRIVARDLVEGVYVVTARASTRDGRGDEDVGAVNVKGLAGDALANAMMKCLTKAKRRVTLSICGLGWLDETETETIPDAHPVEPEAAPVPMPRAPAGPAPGVELKRKLSGYTADGLFRKGELLQLVTLWAEAEGIDVPMGGWNAEQVHDAQVECKRLVEGRQEASEQRRAQEQMAEG